MPPDHDHKFLLSTLARGSKDYKYLTTAEFGKPQPIEGSRRADGRLIISLSALHA